MIAPVARIILRYGVGVVAGMQIGDQLASDPDLVILIAGIIAASVEGAYVMAKRKGWRT